MARTWPARLGDQANEACRAALTGLAGIPERARPRAGDDAGHFDSNFDYVSVLDFADFAVALCTDDCGPPLLSTAADAASESAPDAGASVLGRPALQSAAAAVSRSWQVVWNGLDARTAAGYRDGSPV